jgi:hypothetical protein
LVSHKRIIAFVSRIKLQINVVNKELKIIGLSNKVIYFCVQSYCRFKEFLLKKYGIIISSSSRSSSSNSRSSSSSSSIAAVAAAVAEVIAVVALVAVAVAAVAPTEIHGCY